jgi:drug/metabolite transporter (DMT)-like permease
LVTGSLNTISTKLADKTSSVGRGGGPPREFNHPFVQAAGMFIGEYFCMIAFVLLKWYYSGRKDDAGEEIVVDTAKPFNPLIFWLPACCDMTGTSLMYLGLTMTDASVFQMLRGSVVIFTGVFSVVFLGNRLQKHHWTAMMLVLIGVGIVGYASVAAKSGTPTPGYHSGSTDLYSPYDVRATWAAYSSGSYSSGGNSSNPYANCGTAASAESQAFLGNCLIVASQLIVAVQMCVEEKFVGGYNIPALQAVGWEGFFGFCTISCVLVGMAHITDDTKETCVFEDTWDALVQLSNSAVIVLAVFGNVASIAFFNFFGISVTKSMSASHRMVLDSVRTFVIWGFGLITGWEQFHDLQLVGFAILLAGTALYNEILLLPCFTYETSDPDDPKLLGEQSGCCGMFTISYVLVEASAEDPYDLLEEDMRAADGLKAPMMSPGSSLGKHLGRSFTTVDDLRTSHIEGSDSFNGSATDSFTGGGSKNKSTTADPRGSFTASFTGVAK